MKQSEAKKKKKKRMLIATLGVAAVIVGGLTFAWYTSQDEVTNTFKTSGNLKTVVVENFTPPTNWQPGVTTDKVVQVTNTGTIDAYTRVQISEDLSFYTRGEAVELVKASTSDTTSGENGSTTEDSENTVVGSGDSSGSGSTETTTEATTAATTDTTTYITVNKNSIIDSINNWNSDTNNANDQFVNIAGTDYATLLDGLTVAGKDAADDAEGVHLWVKESDAQTVDSDSATIEKGKNLQFIGYYVKDGEAYELKIEPNIVYRALGEDTTTTTTSTVRNEDTNQDEEVSVTTTVANPDTTGTKSVFTDNINLDTDASSIKLSLYKGTLTTVTDDKIKNYVEIEFANDGAWYYKNGYFYYNKVLKSGETTTPLIKAVRLKDEVGDEMLNATYNLKVYSDSTQATDEAAKGVFGVENYSTTIVGQKNFVVATYTGACDYSVTNKLVCSDNSTNANVIAFNQLRGQKADKDVTQTTPENNKVPVENGEAED